MSHDPYLPPATPVGEFVTAERIERPPAVYVAIVLILMGTAIEAFNRLRFMVPLPVGATLWIEIAWLIVLLAVTLGSCFYVARRRNWARYVLLVFIAMDVVAVAKIIWDAFSMAPAIVGFVPSATLLLFGSPPIFKLAGLVALFGPARKWFESNR